MGMRSPRPPELRGELSKKPREQLRRPVYPRSATALSEPLMSPAYVVASGLLAPVANSSSLVLLVVMLVSASHMQGRDVLTQLEDSARSALTELHSSHCGSSLSLPASWVLLLLLLLNLCPAGHPVCHLPTDGLFCSVQRAAVGRDLVLFRSSEHLLGLGLGCFDTALTVKGLTSTCHSMCDSPNVTQHKSGLTVRSCPRPTTHPGCMLAGFAPAGSLALAALNAVQISIPPPSA